MSLALGLALEQQAKQYLVKLGMRFVTANYRCRWGEVDLIMREGDYLVFVEVRARRSSTYGGAIESITLSKQNKILKTALHYMTVNSILEKYPCRFDVICFQGDHSNFELIRNAFTSD